MEIEKWMKMRHEKLKKWCVLLLLGFLFSGLQAQETIPAAGGDASGSGGTVSYSIGQLVYTTYTGTNGSVAQGVQQPFEISVISSIKTAKGINLKCLAYPNPVNDYLLLKVENYENRNLSYMLFDINGKLLENKKVTSNDTSILMIHLATSTYFLKVVDENQEIKTFKIIKN